MLDGTLHRWQTEICFSDNIRCAAADLPGWQQSILDHPYYSHLADA
jgi:hypothetical protein